MSKKSKPFLAHSELTDCIYIIDGNDKYEVTDQCISAMKATNRMPRWIPVSERLPDDEQDVLITVKNYKDVSKVSVSTDVFYNDGEDGCYFETYNFDDVIAWMPFPTPYQSEIQTGAEGSEE